MQPILKIVKSLLKMETLMITITKNDKLGKLLCQYKLIYFVNWKISKTEIVDLSHPH